MRSRDHIHTHTSQTTAVGVASVIYIYIYIYTRIYRCGVSSELDLEEIVSRMTAPMDIEEEEYEVEALAAAVVRNRLHHVRVAGIRRCAVFAGRRSQPEA